MYVYILLYMYVSIFTFCLLNHLFKQIDFPYVNAFVNFVYKFPLNCSWFMEIECFCVRMSIILRVGWFCMGQWMAIVFHFPDKCVISLAKARRHYLSSWQLQSYDLSRFVNWMFVIVYSHIYLVVYMREYVEMLLQKLFLLKWKILRRAV